jgi:hypothetical protein
MKAVLTGAQNYDNVKMQDGSVLDGAKVFFTYASPDVKGLAADGKYISREHLNAFKVTYETLEENVGADIDIDYGPKNKIVGLALIALGGNLKHSQEKIK